MGKKKHSKGIRSKGERKNVSNWIKRAMRKEHMSSGARQIAQYDAYRKGKKVMLTIENPNTNETNRPFIRIDAWKVWGNPNITKKKAA